MKLREFQSKTFGKWITIIPTIELHINNPLFKTPNVAIILNVFIWHFRWLFIKEDKTE